MSSPSRCSICKQQAYRDKSGRMMLHTRREVPDAIGGKIYSVICEGSDTGAKP